MSSKLRPLSSRRQHGVVLAVVLIVLVVMMLGAVSLLSSVDTSALLSGNIAFKRDSVNSAATGLNEAFKLLKKTDAASIQGSQNSVDGCPPPASTGSACTAAGTWAKNNFYPRLLESDGNGIPLILKNKAKFDATFTYKITPSNGNEVRFLIERMCEVYGASTNPNCLLSQDASKGTDIYPGKPGSVASPLYRVTVRTDGVRNSQSYAQWTVTFLDE